VIKVIQKLLYRLIFGDERLYLKIEPIIIMLFISV